ncbi:MAG: transglutaminase-like domain-containing protein [Firmicutes bacterium]|nr:transglutaminase-like domain-containing protein [Bacillota bacterium]
MIRAMIVVLLGLGSLWSQEAVRFRLWLGGREAGGREVRVSQEGGRLRVESQEWMRVERLGQPVEQNLRQTAWRASDGAVEFQWSVKLAQEPMQGRAFWNPAAPRTLQLKSEGLSEQQIALPEDTLLWPGDVDARCKEAARKRVALRFRSYTPFMQQIEELDLTCAGPDPLPGFPDAVRFQGTSRQGTMASELALWVSPTVGELKQIEVMAGLTLHMQRAELPPPRIQEEGFFARTLTPLPPHPFLPWLREAALEWRGEGEQRLPEDPQQRRIGVNRYAVQRAAEPSEEEQLEKPIQGEASAQDAPYLAATPLVAYRDPVFEGLVARLRPDPLATRWQLAKAVNRFVFEWIAEKDFSVGFASASEVARRPRGDCTEHGVLAVALLRRLGVPARGAMGWVGADSTFGMHFWVEVRLRDRWVPVDPTFDEAPASAFRLKLSDTDLADLGSLGWDSLAVRMVGGGWRPFGSWSQTLRLQGEQVQAPGGEKLSLSGARWSLEGGFLRLHGKGIHRVEAVSRPTEEALRGAQIAENPTLGRRGWWRADLQCLFLRLDESHWIRVSSVNQAQALDLLERLQWAAK